MPKKVKSTSGSEAVPATAAGQALGYSLQFTRLTAMLLIAPDGSSCSLEVLDDVAEQTVDGETKLSQSKSSLTGNPVADRAISLWKTIFNWLEVVKTGLVVPSKTTFELYVSRPVNGQLIDAFHESSSVEDAKEAVAKAREELWGKAPDYAKRATLPHGLGCYVNSVLEADEAHLLPIIVSLRLVCGSGSPQADIEAAIRRHPVSEARVLDIADKMCGWVKRQVDKQLEKGLAAVILRDDFQREYTSYVRSVDRDLILKGLGKKPSKAEKLECLQDNFVQQLDLIERSFDDKLAAISDFLQACRDRAMWSQAGDVHENSFTELKDDLERTWKNMHLAISIEAASKTEIQRGQLLYARCMMHKARIQGMEPPPHFVPGCFHVLSDDLEIGWHPTYQTLLKKPPIKPS
ncbi:MAG TPA: ABC-three component system protein [Nitrospira sp.]|nr:ABC-three component system protein [Nitrospira sp.]